MRFRLLPLTLLLAFVSIPFARAFNLPLDKAGPLTARIEAPDSLTRTDTLVPFEVLLENSSEEPLEGTLRLEVIDHFRVSPDDRIPFRVPPKDTVRVSCALVAGKGSHSGLYPIHAFVEFVVDGEGLTAHPVKILKTEFPAEDSRRRDRFPWRPVTVRRDARLKLCDTWTRRTVYRVFGEEEVTVSSIGAGAEEPRHRGQCLLRLTRLERDDAPKHETGGETPDGDERWAFFMHPPWKDGLVGTTLLEFPLALPEGMPILLRFAVGLSPDTRGDGITFRVRVVPFDAPDGKLGEIVYEYHTDAKTWREAEVDLSQYGGRAVRLQLETHPGPENDTAWDHGNWGEPILIVGTPKAEVVPSLDSLKRGIAAGRIRRGSREYEVRVLLGERGLLDATVGFLAEDASSWMHDFQIRVLGELLSDRASPSIVTIASLSGIHDGELAIRHRVAHPAGEFDVVGRLWVERDVLRTSFDLENAPEPEPWFHVHIEDAAVGRWRENPRRIFAGPGNVMVGIRRGFDLGFDGHRCSTSFVGFEFDRMAIVQAVDAPPRGLSVRPSERHASLHAAHAVTFTFIPHDTAFAAAKAWRDVNGLKAGGGVRKAAGRFVFDLWGGRYGPSAEELQKSFRYGLTDAMVVWHNWQRWGYDYRLPDIVPPNPLHGSTEEMIELIETCKRRGVPFAPHDNYIDFYPDAGGFSYERTIAFHENGRPVLAWLNEGRGAQSYRYRADAISGFLGPNLRWVKKHLEPTGYFIDVWASAAPYDYWTARGDFHASVETTRVWAESFAWIRDLLGGDAPMISESGHDGLIGSLDGAQANHLRVGNPVPGHRYEWAAWNVDCDDAERIPWFDVAHHDRFILHGAGYALRYAAGLPQELHGMFSDDYIATEIMTGRPAMVPSPFGRDVVRKYWLTQSWSRAVAMQAIEAVEFIEGNIHRQYVRWSNGAEAWVNREEEDWYVEGRVLPQYGFFARAPGEHGPSEASVERKKGTIVETAKTPTSLYVNGRMMMTPPARIRPVVESFKSAAGRSFEFDLSWNAATPIPEGYIPFFHFNDEAGEILFQATQVPPGFPDTRRGTLSRKVRASVPGSLPSGKDFTLAVGLYHPDTGSRLEFDFLDDGSRRYELGSIRLKTGSDGREQVLWNPVAPRENRALSRWNMLAEPVDFGPVRTAGGCRITLEEGAESSQGVSANALVITPLPAERGAAAELRIRPESLPWKSGPLTTVRAFDLAGRERVSRSAVRLEDGEVVLNIEPGVFQYRLGR